jgi:diphthamide biosynthesis protein 4
MDNLYGILGCHKHATYTELKKKYQELALLNHPDKQKNTSLSTVFMEIDKAWKILRDPEQRKLYDYQLAQLQLSGQPVIYASLPISELDWNKDSLNYSYLCRCGGLYIIEQSEIELEDRYINCDGCSLMIRVKSDK